MVFVIGLVGFVAFCIFVMRPKNSLKARAQERYRRDRKATRRKERNEMSNRHSSNFLE